VRPGHALASRGLSIGSTPDAAPAHDGARSRIAGIEKLIVDMKPRPGVWLATHEQVARDVKANGKT
jgi:hypothetical protein